MIVLIDQPLKSILHQSNSFEWIAKWALELSELDIHYRPRPSIKIQILADFILECTIHEGKPSEENPMSRYEDPASSQSNEDLKSNQEDPGETWVLHIDGFSNSTGSGARIIFFNPDGDIATYAICFKILAANNESEYEILIARLKIAQQIGAQCLKVYDNFQLMVGQIKEEYEVRKRTMIKYLQKIKDLILSF